MATILAIILAVILDRYARKYSSGRFLEMVRSPSLLNCYLVKLVKILDKVGIKQNYLVILSAFVPLWFGAFILLLLCGMIFSVNVGGFVFIAITLFFFLGNEVDYTQSELVMIHETSFGVLFWFAILGYSGALAYWFLVAAKRSSIVIEDTPLLQAVTRLHAIFAWIPARVTGFIYALVGNFEPSFKCWWNCMTDLHKPSSQVLQECGDSAILINKEDGVASLINRSFISWVVLVIVAALL